MSKVSVLTPSFPRYMNDYHGCFIKSLCDSLSKYVNLEVIAPRSKSLERYQASYPITRFPYMPISNMEYIAETTMKNASMSVLATLPAYLFSAYAHILASRSDLIHTHLAIPLGFLAANNPKRTPQLITCHGSDITYPIEAQIFLPFIKDTLKKANKIVCVSNYIKQLSIKLGANPRKVNTVYLGVDVNKFKPLKSRNNLSIGTLGRLIPEKNIEIIIRAVKELSSRNDLKLKIGGDGPEQIRLMKLAGKLGVKTEFTGRVFNPREFHQSLDVFVLASNREGLSLSLQEAMACGAVPVAVDACGCREIIVDGVNGFLFKAGDHKMLASKINQAINSIDIDVNARKTIESRFNSESATKKYLEIYGDLGIFLKSDLH